MRIAILNFSGNVGKSAIAQYVIAPRQNNKPLALVPEASATGHAGQGKGIETEVPVISSSFKSMLDGKNRDDFTKQILPINPLVKKGK